jgi:hypothetical protein
MTGPIDRSSKSWSGLRKRREALLSKLPPLDAVLRGSLIERYKRCGKPGCKCADGPGHGPKYYLSMSFSGERPQMDYVPQENLEATRARSSPTWSRHGLLPSRAQSPPRRSPMSAMIGVEHRSRPAYVYVRQSTPVQVRHNLKRPRPADWEPEMIFDVAAYAPSRERAFSRGSFPVLNPFPCGSTEIRLARQNPTETRSP